LKSSGIFRSAWNQATTILLPGKGNELGINLHDSPTEWPCGTNIHLGRNTRRVFIKTRIWLRLAL